MASFKVRQSVLVPSSLQVGANGTKVSQILFGTVSGCVPVINASAIGSGSFSVANVPVGAAVQLTIASGAGGLALVGACATANGAISASFVNGTGTNTTASVFSVYYLVVS
jgi:hypothetical protein